jgi:hypothetical protein
LNLIRGLTDIIPIFTNYIGFYYIIREGYEPYIESNISSISKSDIEDYIEKEKHANKDIENYLRKDSTI